MKSKENKNMQLNTRNNHHLKNPLHSNKNNNNNYNYNHIHLITNNNNHNHKTLM